MSWDDVFGHDAVKRLWRAHLAQGRVAPAYLLVGPEGIGKRRLALELAKAINCPSTMLGTEPDAREGFRAEACDACTSCRQIGRHAHPDVHLVSPEGSSGQIRLERVQELLGRLALRPYSGRAQVAILDGADCLTDESANALLKALEEPPGRTCFVLLASQLARCLPTIISRCQLIRAVPLPAATVERLLREHAQVPAEAAAAASRQSGGSVARAKALIEGWPLRSQRLARLAHGTLIDWVQELGTETRQEVLDWLDTMAEWLRDLAVVSAGGRQALRLPEHEAALRRQAQHLSPQRCAEALMELLALRESVEQFVSPRLASALARETWLSLVESPSL
jgi:DNA polymerase-3 subunit delta'